MVILEFQATLGGRRFESPIECRELGPKTAVTPLVERKARIPAIGYRHTHNPDEAALPQRHTHWRLGNLQADLGTTGNPYAIWILPHRMREICPIQDRHPLEYIQMIHYFGGTLHPNDSVNEEGLHRFVADRGQVPLSQVRFTCREVCQKP